MYSNNKMSLESYEILGIHPNSELPAIRQAFRNLALQTHPDHGGNPRLFKIVHNAYREILYTLDAKTRHQFNNMKDNYRQVVQEQQQRPSAPIIDPTNFNRTKFNEVFERHRLHTANDDGYDLSKEITVSAEQYESRVTQYEEPDVISCSGSFTNLGQKKIDDFTAPFNAKIQYTDAQRAFGIPTEESKLNTRKEYSSLKDIRRERTQMKLVASAEEEEEHQKVQQRKMELEKMRQKNYRKQLKRGQDMGDRMTKFIGL
jgi:curved DNA-binding protein CbpA